MPQKVGSQSPFPRCGLLQIDLGGIAGLRRWIQFRSEHRQNVADVHLVLAARERVPQEQVLQGNNSNNLVMPPRPKDDIARFQRHTNG